MFLLLAREIRDEPTRLTNENARRRNRRAVRSCVIALGQNRKSFLAAGRLIDDGGVSGNESEPDHAGRTTLAIFIRFRRLLSTTILVLVHLHMGAAAGFG